MSLPTDITLRQKVETELEWDPEVDSSKISVTADEGGQIELSGQVRSYSEKWSAEHIARRVYGVQTLANEIEVLLPDVDSMDDAHIVESALSALNWNFIVPQGRIRVLATRGFITLEGDVDWHYQKRAAEDATRSLRGVRGMSNQIAVTAHVRVGDVKSKIEAALKRNAEIDAKKVIIETDDGSVTLSGLVRSWAEHDDILTAAWAAPGVTKVVDHLAISVLPAFRAGFGREEAENGPEARRTAVSRRRPD
jgi:osmotically-inducible protein OsmY